MIDVVKLCDELYPDFDCRIMPKSSVGLTELVKCGFTMQDMLRETEITEENIIKYLADNSSDPYVIDFFKKYYSAFRIDADKVIIITDTHLGGKYGSYEMINYIYDYAIRNNIKYIIHVGDIVEGYCNPVYKAPIIEEQLDELKRLYPQNTGIKMLYILGNHDYLFGFDRWYEKNHDTLLVKDTLDEFKDMEFIGVMRSFINFYGEHRVMLHHVIKNGIRIPNMDYDFILRGHGHEYFYCPNNEDLIDLPALRKHYYSFDKFDYEGFGFLVLSLLDKGYGVESHIVRNGVIESKEEEKKLVYKR